MGVTFLTGVSSGIGRSLARILPAKLVDRLLAGRGKTAPGDASG